MFRLKCHVVIDGSLQLSSKFEGHHVRHNFTDIYKIRIAEVHLYGKVMFERFDKAMDPKRASETSGWSILRKDVQNLFI
jgi:hypothetical protein